MRLLPSLFAEGLTKYALPLFSIGPLQINNSMIMAGAASLVVIVVVQVAMRKPQLVPSGLQNLVEWLVEVMSDFLEGITGRETMQRGFWYFACVFVFIFAGNLLGLIPGVGTIGWGHGPNWWNLEIDHPFLRGANADDNLTAAYAMIFFFMFFYWCIRHLGLRSFLVHIFGSQVQFPNLALNSLFVLIFFFVGIIELVVILFVRPLAFTFRLYGNIYGGESFLDTIYHSSPNYLLGCLFLSIGYVWEFIVAFIQSFVFFILTAVFTGMLTNSGTSEGEAKSSH
jgi:F-type H+-transporting ATPase subunit a